MTPGEMRRARMNRGVSIRGLAREIEVPEQSIRRIESGRPISLPYAKKVADWHGVEVLDILPDEVAA
jgi:ribosome-binding protein aMBF1 (putative translation factor)